MRAAIPGGASRQPVAVAALVLGSALLAWIALYVRMRGMDGGPGTDLGGLGWFLGVWLTMTAAMMFPSALPMVVLFSRVVRDRARRGAAHASIGTFLAGYVVVWTAFGLVAYAVFRAVEGLELGFLAWSEQGPRVAGAAIGAAGLYQLTPLKRVCLRHCRTPLHFVLQGWREGQLGALRMGLEHGGWCVGCCWALMVILFALGVMSLVWMALIAVVILAEKTSPVGARLQTPFAVVFVALGLWIAVAPAALPGLTEPGQEPTMPMAP